MISGFHSQIEKDVLHYLLKGDQPIIVALARGLKKRIEPEFKEALAQNRLLIITPFEKEVTRITANNAMIRNELMIDLAEDVTVGYVSTEGNLEKILKQTRKPVTKLK